MLGTKIVLKEKKISNNGIYCKITSYISGWEALNLPKEDGTTADWHPFLYPPLEKYEYNELLKDLGIKLRNINGNFRYVANFPRAIADLVFVGDTKQLKNCVYDFLTKEETIELFEYLKKINEVKDIQHFIKTELTKLYFEDKINVSTSKQ